MRFKRLLPALFAAIVAVSPATKASENDSLFINAQGKLVIPDLRIGNDTYFVILQRSNLAGYNFNLSAATVVKVTPQPGDDWASRTEVVGDWTIQEIPGVALGIFASGSYSVSSPVEPDCPAGTETGTWTIDESTGVFFPVAKVDPNGDCGFSHPDGVMRIKRVGANLEITLYETENGKQVVNKVTAQPR
jgi:hypothetical protein